MTVRGAAPLAHSLAGSARSALPDVTNPLWRTASRSIAAASDTSSAAALASRTTSSSLPLPLLLAF